MAINKRAYAFIFRSKPNGEKELLAFKVKGEPPNRFFQLPGGGIDRGETPEEGVIREVEEESGLQGLKPTKFIGSKITQYEDGAYQRFFFRFDELPANLPDRWEHQVTGGGDDEGKTFIYQWLNYNSVFSIYRTFLPFIHTEHFEDFFPHQKEIGTSPLDLSLKPFSKYWNIYFEAERDILKTMLKQHINDIYHIGSTAIADLPGRPIIDLAISYPSQTNIKEVFKALELVGYQHFGPSGIPGRQLFKKIRNGKEFFNVHLFHSNSIFLERSLHFTKNVKLDYDLEERYLKKKLSITANHQYAPKDYAEAKQSYFNAFFQNIAAHQELQLLP